MYGNPYFMKTLKKGWITGVLEWQHDRAIS